ncbi:MAG: hypothetical protein ACM3NW_12655 [Syntrophomonadaceae bacterium]
MTVSCRDLERALSGEDPELVAAFETHAGSCPSCGRELSEWRRISEVAPKLHRAWDSPELLPRIRQALAEESTRPTETPTAPARRFAWLPAASIAALFVVATAGLFVFRNSGGREPLTEHWKTTKAPLLTDAAIDEVDRAEQAYLASIDKLSKLAEPALSNATSPVMVNYREKLTVLDSAIAELKASVDQNRGNTHLRRELLAVYQEKQRTLQDLMKEVKS